MRRAAPSGVRPGGAATAARAREAGTAAAGVGTLCASSRLVERRRRLSRCLVTNSTLRTRRRREVPVPKVSSSIHLRGHRRRCRDPLDNAPAMGRRLGRRLTHADSEFSAYAGMNRTKDRAYADAHRVPAPAGMNRYIAGAFSTASQVPHQTAVHTVPTPPSITPRQPQHMLRHVVQHHLLRDRRDPLQPGFPPIALHVVLLGVAEAAVGLHGLVGGLEASIRR